MEKLIVDNFAGIKHLEIELNKINIILGPQASGKSVTAKLFFYFKSFFGEIRQAIEDNKSKREIDKEYLNRFITYFPKETWPGKDFSICYSVNETSMQIIKKNGNSIKFEYSDNIKKLIGQSRILLRNEQEKLSNSKHISPLEVSQNFLDKYNQLLDEKISANSKYDQIFIPAGRSFFSNIQSSIFTFLSSNKSLDPFLIQFGSFYENYKRFTSDVSLTGKSKTDKEFDDLFNKILNSDYLREKEKDYLIHDDKRKVNISNASSGQQEILPLLLILKTLLNISFFGKGAVLYIEEPEAHLFPNAQKIVVKLLSRIFNSKKNNFQIIITTHSPYILSSFNNLMYAGYLKRTIKNVDKLYSIIPEKEILLPDDVTAYSLTAAKNLEKVIDKETQLISQNVLDNVSNEISTEFGKLMDLEL